MKRTLITLATLLVAYAANAGAGTPLADLLGDAQSVSASFEQEIYAAEDGSLIEASAGTLLIERPDRFRWTYDDPEQVIVADGRKIFFYDVELDQLTISDQGDALAGTPAALLGGGEAALAGFKVIGEYEAAGLQWTRLEPVTEQPDFERITLGFTGTGELAAMDLADALGQQTRIRLSDYQPDPSIPDGAFKIDVPEWVDVIDKSESGRVAAQP